MTYRTILVHLHDRRRARRLLDVAVPMAQRMKAHLIGLVVIPPYVVLPGGELGGTTMTVDEHREAYKNEMADLKAAFTEATRTSASTSEWREVDANFGTAAGMIIEHGRVCDLIIASQKDPEWTLSDFLEEPERLAIESGRPVLLVPNKGKLTAQPKRVTIAWNGRREAARAVFDGLPLLTGTDEVNVVWVNAGRDSPGSGDVPGAELGTTLARHGIKCVISQASADDVSTELLHQCSSFGSELLVMGAYGHSRFREFVMGGASRGILSSMDRLVLMTH